ncbi:hypothetical protein EVAR_95590_1 [Eumeta japonica]|uniref:Uncharacterized protein n=1 Tax=Eumeta variegata TaxID=151549 RepID=A0A4C1VKB2_EUMVA|nr:hypothetical protein EVAR_95590_1 [Eumeta japonica]
MGDVELTLQQVLACFGRGCRRPHRQRKLPRLLWETGAGPRASDLMGGNTVEAAVAFVAFKGCRLHVHWEHLLQPFLDHRSREETIKRNHQTVNKVTPANGHLQPQRTHQCVASRLGGNRISNGGDSGIMEGGEEGVDRRSSQSMDEKKQRKLPLHVRIL